MKKGPRMLPSRIVLFAVLLSFLALFASAEELQGPRIYVPQPRHDLGTVQVGDRPEHTFEIRNVGNELLVIGGIKPS